MNKSASYMFLDLHEVFRSSCEPSYLERASGNVEVVPLDEKQCRSRLVVRVELYPIRPISEVLRRRNNLWRLGSCHPSFEGIVPVPDGDVVAVEVSR